MFSHFHFDTNIAVIIRMIKLTYDGAFLFDYNTVLIMKKKAHVIYAKRTAKQTNAN